MQKRVPRVYQEAIRGWTCFIFRQKMAKDAKTRQSCFPWGKLEGNEFLFPLEKNLNDIYKIMQDPKHFIIQQLKIMGLLVEYGSSYGGKCGGDA